MFSLELKKKEDFFHHWLFDHGLILPPHFYDLKEQSGGPWLNLSEYLVNFV